MSQVHPRIRRLNKDEQDMVNEIENRSDLITYKIVERRPGMPADKYEVTYHVKGITRYNGNEPVYGNQHKVRIMLHEQYPAHAPALKWLTSIWHPNIHHKDGGVCINQGWWAPSRTLVSLVLMMGEMIQGKNVHYLHEPPYPLDNLAAEWYQEYANRNGWSAWQASDSRPLQRPEGEPSPPPQPTSSGGWIKIRPSSETTSSTPPPQVTDTDSKPRIKFGRNRAENTSVESSESPSESPADIPSDENKNKGRLKFRPRNTD